MLGPTHIHRQVQLYVVASRGTNGISRRGEVMGMARAKHCSSVLFMYIWSETVHSCPVSLLAEGRE
jgi:hypothetical protein